MGEREAGFIGRALGIAQVDAMIVREAGRHRDREQAALATISDLGHAGDLDLVLAGRNQPELARLLAHQQPLVRQEGDLPREIEMIDRGQRERLIRIGLERSFIDLRLPAGRKRSEQGSGEQRAAKHEA